MKINDITTIVDLAFNLSGSLAGIPVILPQLPVGERIGFDALPKVWENVDDIGQTWTPNLDGVEVDITVEAYNPTAIQKAPYSSDMRRIDVASGWGNALLEVLESGEYVAITDIPTDVTYVDSVRVINLNEPVVIKANRRTSYSSFVNFVYVTPVAPNLVSYIDFGAAATSTDTPQFNCVFGTDRTVAEVVRARLNFASDGLTAKLTPWYGLQSLWPSNPNTVNDWFDVSIGVPTLYAVAQAQADRAMWAAPFDQGWAFERNVFVKIRK